MDWRCNRCCAASFLLFHTSSPRVQSQTEGLASTLTLLSFFFLPLGEAEPTVRTRQDPAGAGGQNTLFKSRQGRCAFLPYLVAVCSRRRVL